MENIQDGHEKLETLYHLYEQKMYRVAYSILNNTEQAEDVVQESFYKLFEMINKIEILDSDKTKKLIMRIVKNKAIDVYRKNRRESGLVADIQSEQAEHSMNREDFKIQRVIEKETILQILAKLPEDYKEILKYRCFYELSTKETADILGITETAVRKRYERAKKFIINMSGDELNEAIRLY